MYVVNIKRHFAAAHFLKGYDGACNQMHGHNWNIEAVVQSEELDELGLVADFSYLKKKLEEVIDILDHTCLNDHEFFKKNNPSTENVARYIYTEYQKKLGDLKVKYIEVHESERQSVQYYE